MKKRNDISLGNINGILHVSKLYKQIRTLRKIFKLTLTKMRMTLKEKTAYRILNREGGVSVEQFRRDYCEWEGIKLPEDSSSSVGRAWRSLFAPAVEEVRSYLTSLAREGHVERAGSNGLHRLSENGRGYLYNSLTLEK
jgi:hypothetical protein